MKVYVAGSYAYKAQINELVDFLRRNVPGFTCSSRWLLQEQEEDINSDSAQELIDKDLTDIDMSDALLLVNAPGMCNASPGRWIEVGYALSSGKLIIAWGNAHPSMFLRDKFIVWLQSDSRAELVKTLYAIQVAYNVCDAGGPDGSRRDERGVDYPLSQGASTRPDEDRSEGARPGTRYGEGVSLRSVIAAIRRRAARIRAAAQDSRG